MIHTIPCEVSVARRRVSRLALAAIQYYGICSLIGLVQSRNSGIGRPLYRGDGFPVGQKRKFTSCNPQGKQRQRVFFSILLLAHSNNLFVDMLFNIFSGSFCLVRLQWQEAC